MANSQAMGTNRSRKRRPPCGRPQQPRRPHKSKHARPALERYKPIS
jgi:hypothetical protein